MAELKCIPLEESVAASDDWRDFDVFQEEVPSEIHTLRSKEMLTTEIVPKNCVIGDSSDVTSDSTALPDLLARCFCRTVNKYNTTNASNCPSTCLPVSIKIPIDNQIWETVINNIGNVLPVDWLTTRAHNLQLGSLKITALKDYSHQSAADIDASEDEELQQAFDMHSLIVSSVHHDDPLFTADEVIREIEDMLEEPPSPTINGSDHDELYAEELQKMRTRSQARISVTRDTVDGMSSSTLSELYDELDALVRELSEELIQELARRDELEYEKELKNQFIALLLSIQRRQRDLIESKRRNTGSAKTTDGAYGGNQPGCFLTTLIPYSDNMLPPSIEHLEIYVKILTAINEDSPLVPALLTDYILKVICPTV